MRHDDDQEGMRRYFYLRPMQDVGLIEESGSRGAYSHQTATALPVTLTVKPSGADRRQRSPQGSTALVQLRRRESPVGADSVEKLFLDRGTCA